MEALADELFGSPATATSAGGRPARGDRRAVGSLCREVERAVSWALATAGDPRLQSLVVVEVAPAPDASRLSVVVTSDELDLDVAHARLTAATGILRAEVAQALQRKRTPELVFAVIPRLEDHEP